MVQLALHKNDKRWGSRLICWWTNSIYSHCELVVDGWCYSSSILDKGVRCKKVGPGEDEIDLSNGNWDLIDLPSADARKIQNYFLVTDSHTYGWWALIFSQFFNRNESAKDSQFCSEWCAAALGLPNPPSYSPGSLALTCDYLMSLQPAGPLMA